MITGFLTFLLWAVINVVLMVVFGVDEKPKRKHYIRNGILYALITMSLALILIVVYIKYWDYLMMFWFWFIMVALMLIGLFGNIKR